ncbi:DUF4234 domain-containing protein [Mycoplasmatota bacterium WC44]
MKQRSIVLMILLIIVTLGFYLLYWNVKFQVELKRETGEGFGGFAHFLMLLFTFGIYGIYWQYAAGKRLVKQGADDYSILYLIFCFFALSWLNPFLMQNQANKF